MDWHDHVSDPKWLTVPALARALLAGLRMFADDDGAIPIAVDEGIDDWAPRLMAAHQAERDVVAALTDDLVRFGYLRRVGPVVIVRLPPPRRDEDGRRATAERQARYRAKYPRHAHVFARDGYACRYCRSPEDLQIDHVIPRSQGGRDTEDNLVVACAQCNGRKGKRTPEQAGMPLLPIGGA